MCVLLPQQDLLQVFFTLHYSLHMLIVHKGYLPGLFLVVLEHGGGIDCLPRPDTPVKTDSLIQRMECSNATLFQRYCSALCFIIMKQMRVKISKCKLVSSDTWMCL